MSGNTASFQDQVVIVTGASHGIGAHVATQLAAQGAKLVLAARRAIELEQTAAACRAAGAEALVVPTDVTSETECARLIVAAIEKFGRIDMLVNNAGLGMWSRVDAVHDLTIFERVMQVNYFGAVYCTVHALPHLNQSRGRIVCVSSLAGRTCPVQRSSYSGVNTVCR